jgi:hypothetical protein
MLGYLQRGWIERSQKWGRDKTMFAPTFFGYNLEKKTQNVYHEHKTCSVIIGINKKYVSKPRISFFWLVSFESFLFIS